MAAAEMEINKSKGLLLLARMYLQQSQHDEAANYFTKYVEEHNEFDSREGLLEALLGLVFAKYQLSQYEESAKYISQYVEVDSREGLLEALLGRGVANYGLSKYEEAAKYFSMYIEMHTEADRREGLLEALLGLGRAKGEFEKYEESAKYLSQYVELHTEADSRENLLQALLGLGTAKYRLSQYEESAKYYSMYIERHTDVDKREDLLKAFMGLGLAKQELSQYEEAAKNNSVYIQRHTDKHTGECLFAALPGHGKANNIVLSFTVSPEHFSQDVALHNEAGSREAGSREGLLNLFLTLGLTYEQLSQYEEAAKFYLMYIERHTGAEKREDLLKAFLGVGAAKYELLQYEESAKYFSQYVEVHTEVDSREGLLQALLMLGLAKYELSQYEESAKYFSQYLELHTEADSREGLLEVLLKLGCAKYHLSQYEESAKYNSLYIERHTDVDNRQDLLQALLALGLAKYELSQYEESAKYNSMYVERHTEVDSREHLLEALLVLGLANHRLLQYEEAAKYYSMYIERHTDRDRREGLLEALLRLGYAKYKLSQYEESAEYNSMYIERHTDVDRRERLLEALLVLGLAKNELSQYEESSKYLSQYVELHTEVDSRDVLLEVLLKLGAAMYQLSQYEESAKYNSIYIERHTDDDRREGLLEALLGLGAAKHKLSQYEESAKYNSMYIERHTDDDRREALLEALLWLGEAKYQLSQYEESAKYNSMYIERHTHDDRREGLLEALLWLGAAKYQLSQYEESAKYNSMYIERHTSDDRREGLLKAFLGVGAAKHKLSQYAKSAQHFSQYVELHTEVDRREDLLQALLGLGLAKYELSQYEESAKYFSQYVKVHTEVDSRGDLLQALLIIGCAKYELSQPEEAAKYFSMCIERHTDADRRDSLLDALLILGDIKLQKNGCDEAIQLFQEYSSIANEIDDKRVMMEKYELVGSCCHRRQMFKLSGKWLEKGLSLAKELNDIDSQVRISNQLLSAYSNSGENKKSISLVDYLTDEIDDGEKSKEKPENFVRFLVMKLKREYESGLLHEAYDTAVKAVKASSSTKGDEKMHVQCLLNLAFVSLAKELYHDVEINLDKALRICEHKSCLIDYKMDALHIYAYMHDKLHQYDKAQEKASELLKTALGTGDKEKQLDYLFLLGWISIRKGNLVGAEMFCQEMEKFSSNIQNPKFSKNELSLLTLIEVEKERGNGVAVLSMIKKFLEIQITHTSNVPILYDRLIRSLIKLTDNPNVKEHIMSQFTDILKKILVHNEKISSSYGEHDKHRVAALTKSIDGYKLLVQLLIDEERTHEAIVFADRGRMCILQDILQQKYCMDVTDESENEKLDLGGIRNIAVKERCCIVFYLMVQECLMIWIISEKGIECEKLTKFVCEERELLFERETDPAYYLGKVVYHLDDEVGHASVFRGAASTDSENVETADCGDEDLMIPESTLSEYCGETGDERLMSCNHFELLYDWLIAPIEDKLTEDKILIIPDNFMFQIPFIALKDKKTGKHLADMKSVRLAPSLMALQILNDPVSSNKHSKGGALVVAADDVGKVKYKGKEVTFKKLEYAAQEAKMIGKLLNVDPLIGKEAKKCAVVEQLSGDYKVLHIAAHGKFPGKIILTPNDTSTGCLPRVRDYILQMSDVMKIGVRAQLVVLSCCSSGDGQQTAEGIIGFGRAFLAAGARAVLVALWNVKDRATFLLMEKFYECFVDGKSASDSLSEAVRALKSIEEYKHETSWGPYALLGGEVYWNEKEPGLLHFSFAPESPLNVI